MNVFFITHTTVFVLLLKLRDVTNQKFYELKAYANLFSYFIFERGNRKKVKYH